jgi:DNA-binding SARP family transcriptional activator
VAADRLIDLLWGDDAPKAAVSLQAYVSNLRRALEPDRRPREAATVLLTQPPGYRLTVPRAALDATRFEDLVREGRRLLVAGDSLAARASLDRALADWAGPPLPELAALPLVVDAQTRLGALQGSALEAAAEADLALGDHERALARLEPDAGTHALREHFQGLLALARYRSGRQTDALRTIDAVRRALADVGLEPGTELRRLETDLLAQSPDLDWRPTAGPSPTVVTEARRPAGPAPRPSTDPFVGRAVELAALTGALDDARAARGGVAMIIGEPGVGKTRLADELAVIARQLGVVVARARCPEDGAAPPYWPVTQLTAELVRAGAPAALFPDVEGDVPAFELRRQAARAVVGAPAPALLVVDDLQWADPDSLRMLEHIAGELRMSRVLLVVTVRPPEDATPDAVVDCLAGLTRAAGSIRLDLVGLAEEAVGQWLAAKTGHPVAADVVAVVHHRTGGNALFVRELSELFSGDGELGDEDATRAAAHIPRGVQFVVRRRVTRLPAETQRLLSTASVVGRSFDLAVLAAVQDEADAVVLERLVPALDAGLVGAGDEPATFRFSHALVAEALAAEVNAARRAMIHAATARVLDALGATDAAIVAHHALEGMAAGTAALAYAMSARAAQHATARIAHAFAAGHWRRALVALERAHPDDRATRFDVLMDLAKSLQRADLIADAQRTILAAISLAEAGGDREAMGAAATLVNTPSIWANQAYGVVDEEVVSALERTLVAIGPEDSPTRALVLGALAGEMAFSADVDRLDAYSDEAVTIARRVGDPIIRGTVLINRFHALMGNESLPARRVAVQEALALADAGGLPDELAVVAHFRDAAVRFEDADVDGCEAALERCRPFVEGARGFGFRSQLGWYRALIEVVRGRYEEARLESERAYELHRHGRNRDSDLIRAAVELAIRHDLGTDGPPFGLLAGFAAGTGFEPTLREYLSAIALEADAHADVAALLPPPGHVPPARRNDHAMLLTHTAAAHVRADLGDADAAAVLVERLAPFAGRLTSVGAAPPTFGLVDLALARVLSVIGRRDEARAAFAAAVTGHERAGAPAWLARSLLYQGGFLVEAGEVDAGGAALARASAIAERYRLVHVARRAAAAAK